MVKVLKIRTLEELKRHFHYIKKIILEGKVFICGTDTLYGLCANALDESALEKVYSIKERERGKPVSIFLRSTEDIKRYAYLDDTGRKIVERFLPGPLTIVLKKKDIIPDALSKDYVGIRVPKSEIVRELSIVPLTATSANISRERPPTSFEEIDDRIKERVDLIIDTGVCPYRRPSTVIKVVDGKVELIREGAVDFGEIKKVVEEE
ncbi:L-threonylcarbamoyladenylate synthase [Methanofervidicoccus abyssi]|uniref:L-threonylcarbamoyladenylate synthase n=1 Tax=Methanofervidicoccus abyssi TaxID=2082189 RepID=A0A401HRX6_9EURY|nr:L-threonylcarbamoyladenylate synthase [Methanofervidicoccus abyssi]GBF37016.1 L-threonylcarbamoyladenylate synthase [Methanofervidicoccus abyssi]